MDFWEVIEEMDFNGVGHEEAGRWLVEESGLSIEQLEEVYNVANRKASYIMRLLDDVTGVSDDGFSDVCWQILANGQEAYKNATIESTQEMIDNNDYTESFAYAFHAVDDVVTEHKAALKYLKQERHLQEVRNGFGGGFETKLIAAFDHADSNNKRKLALGFPELFKHLVD
jgi:hypothetical protein